MKSSNDHFLEEELFFLYSVLLPLDDEVNKYKVQKSKGGNISWRKKFFSREVGKND